ncbi:MAG: hypothetical protein ACPGVD_08450 [Flavobacteriales bacterium]
MNTNTITLEKKSSLCQNCDFSGSCIHELTSQEPISFCDEYSISRPKENKTHSISKPENIKYEGLCSTCDFRKDCTFRSENPIIINCEHYQ